MEGGTRYYYGHGIKRVEGLRKYLIVNLSQIKLIRGESIVEEWPRQRQTKAIEYTGNTYCRRPTAT